MSEWKSFMENKSRSLMLETSVYRQYEKTTFPTIIVRNIKKRHPLPFLSIDNGSKSVYLGYLQVVAALCSSYFARLSLTR